MGRYCPIEDKEMSHTYCRECSEHVCEDTFFCLVVGSRSIDDYEFVKTKLDHLLSNHKNIAIVSGGARGVDACAKKYAMEKHCFYKEFPADWERFGKSAGFVRNAEMHKYLSKQKFKGCVAFWDGESVGTKSNFELAKKYGNEIKVVRKDKKNDSKLA